MRKVVLFIAMSLDGCIADENGKVDWLTGQDPDGEMLDTYSQFVQGVDTVLMGWNTYHQVVTELSPDAWPYEGLHTYVFTHRPQASGEEVSFTEEPPCALVRRLKEEPGRDIWICGGADIVNQLMKEDLIDRYHISLIPTILGGGKKLFASRPGAIPLKLLNTQSYNGITDLIYERRSASCIRETNGI